MERKTDMASQTMEDLAEFLKKLKFRRRFIGGVDEDDVWEKIGLLQREYQHVLDIEKAKQQALLDEKLQIIEQMQKKYRNEIYTDREISDSLSEKNQTKDKTEN